MKLQENFSEIYLKKFDVVDQWVDKNDLALTAWFFDDLYLFCACQVS